MHWSDLLLINNPSHLISLAGALFFIVFFLLLKHHQRQLIRKSEQLMSELEQNSRELHQKKEQTLTRALHAMQHALIENMHDNHLKMNHTITETLFQQMNDVRAQIDHSFKNHAETLSTHIQTLHQEVRNNLNQLTQQVNHQLNQGFDKTNTTFGDIIKRLTIIDEAQKRMAELSTQVVSLNDVLNDKKTRGSFGEVQLSALIKNVLPPQHYALQHTLSNKKRADCMLFLPQPTGNLVIDSKFPLENYQALQNIDSARSDKKALRQQFKLDIQKHINDIADKYIIPNETADSAILFLPAESVFAEIHANYPELVNFSHRKKVWLVSPSTLMAVLTTARAVLKDDATRKQIHLIQQHLQALSQDFQRFEKRMDNLNRNIDRAQKDASEVNTSAKKITQRFHKIESVELDKSELLE